MGIMNGGWRCFPTVYLPPIRQVVSESIWTMQCCEKDNCLYCVKCDGRATDDFSGPAESTTFTLGSLIPIMAGVEQHRHQPLLLLLDECVATTTPDLWADGNAYDLIANKGCAWLGKWGALQGVWPLKCLPNHPGVLWTAKYRVPDLNRERSRQRSNCPFKLLGLVSESRYTSFNLRAVLLESFHSDLVHLSGVYPLHAGGSRSKWAGQHQKGLSLSAAWASFVSFKYSNWMGA